ncbi:Gldg family protein [Aquisphaera insulae]|uniref:Gldg family protein n=1 Tax=Aquisphaera insulae TaxID=2712864 RepID=UPI0013EC1416|nr:Gldg family protein [Aquisphaera insulae]
MTTLETQPTSKPPAARRPSAGAGPFRPHVIWAIFKRNLQSYFSNPAGYVFITLFVIICSCVAFWQPEFFASNLANLDQLNRYMPYVLLFFIPAITMTSWADERRQGTDELLLTLPAHDLDVVLGKYLAALGIYTVALGFSLSHLVVLAYLGSPDYGVMFATFLGYWLMGAMLIAVGMVASLLSSNVTVAFIMGALFCAVPIFLEWLGSPTAGSLRRNIESWSVPTQFRDFGTGVVSLSGVFYFASLAAAMLYLNMMLLGRRHWAGGEASQGRWVHSAIRFVAVLVSLFSLSLMFEKSGIRKDLSAERMHTLSADSLALVSQIPADRPVLVQAYYSPEVPREFIQTKSDLLGLLREFEASSGGRIKLNLVPADLYSEAAHEAEKRFGIEPKQVLSEDQAKRSVSEVILGVAFTSGLEEVVVPFFDRGLPVEYELTRSIRVVSRTARKKVGILNTDAKMMGGFDMRSMNQSPEWSVVGELKKQYEVSMVSPDSTVPSDLDALIVGLPSSLTQKQIDNLTTYVKGGGPTILLLDPLPIFNPQLSPSVPRMPPGGMFGGGQPPEPKGDLKPLLDLLGLDWPSTEIVWNRYNPHPQLAMLEPEIVFVGDGSGNAEAFNPKEPATSGLQEVVTLFPGLLRPKAGGAGPEFTPLLRTDDSGGILNWDDAVQQSFMGIGGINPRRRHVSTGSSYTLAARISGPAAQATPPAADSKKDEPKKDEKPATIKVIAIADMDLIGEQFFELRRQKVANLDFDNVTFILNCVDVLAGDDSFVELRKKRLKHRTLERIERETKTFVAEYEKQSKLAEDAAKEKLDDAQKRFNKQVDEVKARTDYDERTKEIMLANLQDVAQRRLDVEKTKVEDERLDKVRDAKAESEQKTRAIENRVRFMAAALPPLPPLLLGLVVFFIRLNRENTGAVPTRLA